MGHRAGPAGFHSILDFDGYQGPTGATYRQLVTFQYDQDTLEMAHAHSCTTDFFFAATVTPVTSDLAAAARELEGIGCKRHSSFYLETYLTLL